jgi:hypothetical protein
MRHSSISGDAHPDGWCTASVTGSYGEERTIEGVCWQENSPENPMVQRYHHTLVAAPSTVPGSYSAGMSPDNGGPRVFGVDYWSHLDHPGGVFHSVQSGCSDQTVDDVYPMSSGAFLPASNDVRCADGTYLENGLLGDVQAVAGTCTYTLVGDDGAGTTNQDTITHEWRMRRADCDPTIDTDGDGIGDCDEHELGSDPTDGGSVPFPDAGGDGDQDGRTNAAEGATDATTGTNTDGDDLPDFLDPDSDNDGIPDAVEEDSDCDSDGIVDWRDADPCGPDPDPGTCTSASTTRGHTVAHYDADYNLARAPDPDFFDWEVSAWWCVENGEVRFQSADSFGEVTLDPAVATALELVGVTFQHDPVDPANFLTPVGSTTVGQVSASTDFEVCANPLMLLTAGTGTAIEKLGIRIAERLMGRMPRSGTAAMWLDDLAPRLDAATIRVEDTLQRTSRRVLNSRAVTPFLPRKMEVGLKAVMDDAFSRDQPRTSRSGLLHRDGVSAGLCSRRSSVLSIPSSRTRTTGR